MNSYYRHQFPTPQRTSNGTSGIPSWQRTDTSPPSLQPSLTANGSPPSLNDEFDEEEKVHVN